MNAHALSKEQLLFGFCVISQLEFIYALQNTQFLNLFHSAESNIRPSDSAIGNIQNKLLCF
jgi:hypothetical protein